MKQVLLRGDRKRKFFRWFCVKKQSLYFSFGFDLVTS